MATMERTSFAIGFTRTATQKSASPVQRFYKGDEGLGPESLEGVTEAGNVLLLGNGSARCPAFSQGTTARNLRILVVVTVALIWSNTIPLSGGYSTHRYCGTNRKRTESLETHPESPPATVDSSFGGPNGRPENSKETKKDIDFSYIYDTT